MGKTTNQPTYVSQDQFDKDLDSSLNILIQDGADDATIESYIDDYKSRYAVKKKENSTSTSVTPKSVSGTQSGSSVGAKQPKFETFTGLNQKELSDLKKPNIQKELEQKTNSKELSFLKSEEFNANRLANRKEITKKHDSIANVTEEEKNNTIQEVNDEVETNGFWNNLKSGFKSTVNAIAEPTQAGINSIKSLFVDGVEVDPKPLFETNPLNTYTSDAKKELIESGVEKPTESQVKEKAKEMYVNKKLSDVKQNKITEFLKDLQPYEKALLEVDKIEKQKTTSQENKNILTSIKVYENNIISEAEDFNTLKTSLEEKLKNGIEISPEEKLEYETKQQAITSKISELSELTKRYNSNKDVVESLEDEIDNIKRNYNASENAFGRIGNESLQMLNNIVLKGVAFIEDNNSSPGGKARALQLLELAKENDAKIQESREKLRKDIENVDSVASALDYVTDLVSTQLPILAATSTGYGGLAAIGFSGTGDKFGQMKDEQLKGSSNYNAFQMAFVPMMFGGSEMIEQNTLRMLGGGKRILQSAVSKPATRELLKESISKQAKNFITNRSKDIVGELKEETLTNVIQNFTDKYVLGKEEVGIFDNQIDVLKDSSVISAILGIAPHVGGAMIKTITPKSELKKLDENSKKILEISKSLENSELSENARVLLTEELEKITKSSNDIIKQSLSNIDKSPIELKEKAVELEKSTSVLRAKAKATNSDSTLKQKDKDIILESLKKEYDSQEQLREKIVSGKATILDVLPENELKNLREKAVDQLVSEKPNSNAAQFTSEIIDNKAIEIYNNSKTKVDDVQENAVTETKQETQPQAEVKETEQEVLEQSNNNQIKEPSDNNGSQKVDADIPNPNQIKNEATPANNTPTDGNVGIGVDPLAEVEQNNNADGNENIQTTKDSGNAKVKTKPITVPGFANKKTTYDVAYDTDGGVSEIRSQKDGRKIQKFRYDKNGKPVGINANYAKIEATALGLDTDNQAKQKRKEILTNFEPSDEYQSALSFFSNGGKVDFDSIKTETGNKDSKWATNQSTNNKLDSIEVVSEKIAENSNVPLDQTEVRNALIEVINSNGSINEVQNKIIESHSENQEKEKQQQMEVFLNSLSEKDMAMYEAQMAEDSFLEELTVEEIAEYYGEQERQRRESETENELGVQPINEESKRNVVTSDEQAEKTEPTEEKVDDKINILDNILNQDEISDALDWLDSLKLDPDNLNSTLPFLPQSWNMFIEAVKLALKAGNSINNAIKEAVKKLKKEGLSDVEINAIVDKFTSQASKKAQSGTFEKKSGKKSVASRIKEGDNSETLKQAVENIGLDYQVQNQEKTQNRAKEFVKRVGIDQALKAVRNNLIKGAEKAFVYAEVLDQLADLSENASIEELGKIQEDYNDILEESLKAFDEEARDAGRFISALNKIYNNSKIRYNLTKQINDFKAYNKGVIDEETLLKFKEADKKLKEIEKQLKDAEKKLIEQEQQLAIKNIEEAIAREIKNKTSNKSKAKKVANQIRRAKVHKPDVFSAATPASLVWDGAVELVAKSIEAGGTLADAIQQGVEYIKNSDWYKQATKDIQKKAVDSFIETMVDDSTQNSATVSISEDGKIRIPESVIKDYVREGLTDIDEISQRIIDDFFPDNEDVTVRLVRDAITRYGKTVNQSKEEIDIEVRKIKRLGKLISAMEDVLEGKRPKKSGLQRDKPTQVEREMLREIKDKIRDLPIDEADLQKQWKNALDTYKQRLKNRIEDLEKQINNKEKDKVKRESTKLDEEAKALKEQVQTLKTTLDELVGKPELTEEQKIKRAETQLESSIDKLTNQIVNNELEYSEKKDPVTSKKIEELRKQKTELNKQLESLRKQAGLVEKKRLEQAKQRLKNRIKELQTKVANKDFTRKKQEPLPADEEIQKLQAEKIKQQEVFDRAKYEAELRDRKWQDYAREILVGVIGLPRLLMAGGEMSMVFIQGGVQTISLALRNPKKLAQIFAKAFVSIGSNEKFLEYEYAIKSDANYMLMKNSKLALTETDYQMEMREEAFIGSNLVYGIWNTIGKGIEIGSVKILGKKELPTIGSAFVSAIKKDIKAKKLPISEQWKNINPLLAFERGNTIYMNEIRKARFMDGVKMLKMEGKNEIDHVDDFKTLAKAVNTLTGRASIGRLENINDYLGIMFFSFKNTVSVFQQLNPWFYSYALRNNYDDWKKPSVAQKIAVKDMMTFVTTTTAMMFLIQAAGGDDDEGNPNIKIELDPRSSDFMTLKVKGKEKDTRFDPWHGMKPQVVLFARLLTGEQKSIKKGRETIKRIGQGYKADTHWDNITKAYVYNKFSPSMQMAYKQMDSEVDKEGNKTFYGENFQDRFNLTPMYIESLREIEKEDPDAMTRFLAALGFFGLNSSTY